jgi:hypothetical protein
MAPARRRTQDDVGRVRSDRFLRRTRPRRARQEGTRLVPALSVLAAIGLLVILVGELVVGRAIEDELAKERMDSRPAQPREPGHVHGLETNPPDGALLLAAHTGLFRVSVNAETITPLSDEVRDLTALTAIGAGRLLASGHAASSTGVPDELGLLESSDGGHSWEVLSPPGGLDLHALRSRNGIVYGSTRPPINSSRVPMEAAAGSNSDSRAR